MPAPSVTPELSPTRATRVSGVGGFSLLELLVVLSILALATSGVMLAWRSSDADTLEREATRLAALLDAARAQSRASGAAARWRAVEGGFRIEGLLGDASALPQRWLDAATGVQIEQPQGAATIALGPEPLTPAHTLRLSLNGQSLRLHSDGVGPFQVQGGGGSP